jgi:hypothetical protein
MYSRTPFVINLIHPKFVTARSYNYDRTLAFLAGKLYVNHRFYATMYWRKEPGSSGSIVSDYGLDDRSIGVRSPAGAKDFSYSLCVQTGSRAHPASSTMGTGGPFPGVKRGRGVTLTTHPHLVPRSRMSRIYTPLPPSASMACSGTALPYFYVLKGTRAINPQCSTGFQWWHIRGAHAYHGTVISLNSRSVGHPTHRNKTSLICSVRLILQNLLDAFRASDD